MNLDYAQWTHSVICVMNVLIEKAGQEMNRWAICLKFVVIHANYINDWDILKPMSVLNATSSPLCIHSKF